jgi:UDP-GalNAc:undecaprenyl-phosphate GalNAc-1-phosphate transferase
MTLNATSKIYSSSIFRAQRQWGSRVLHYVFFAFNCSAIYVGMCIFTYLGYGQISLNENMLNTFFLAVFGCGISTVMASRISQYPGSKPWHYIPAIVFISFISLIAIFGFFRIDYSRAGWFVALIISLVAIFIEFRFWRSNMVGGFALAPFGFYRKLIEVAPGSFELLKDPTFGDRNYAGLIIDGGEKISHEWQLFVARTIVSGMPVLSAIDTYESIAGKSPLDFYSEVGYSDLRPSTLYMIIKRIAEVCVIVLLSPLIITIVAFTCILIKLESPGPAFFIQQRVGKGSKEFAMFKLRSMTTAADEDGPKFATANDMRVTKVGRVIRKYRIDELPQLLNVLLGSMSIVGPRPEQMAFVKKFEKDIPMYSYRHVVRPGITGWAQVTQGYTDDEDSAKEKLAYDFYYVKNISLWMDCNIVLLTIKTVLTGFGAR